MLTARAGQFLLFFLTILLAGMLLSQLIEEKSNKVIEVLAAAVPIDAIFLGKLFAMLATSIVGIAVWTSAGAAAVAAFSEAGLASLPPPAVGWTAFFTLAVVYFAMNYLLLGSVFLSIGAQASTVREVQTLSMPVTMGQVVIFAVATLAIGAPELALAAWPRPIFPLSSPLVMIARAAQLPGLWPHLLAIGWQLVWVVLILRLGSRLFRRSVLQSGPARRWWRRSPRCREDLVQRCARHLFQRRHQRAVRERAVADPRHARARPFRLRRRSGESDDVQRQRHVADDPLDLPRIGEAGHEEAAGPGIGKGLAALDRRIDQRHRHLLRLQEQVGAGVDEEIVADRHADRLDPLRLHL